jgi:hypothetical protein
MAAHQTNVLGSAGGTQDHVIMDRLRGAKEDSPAKP